MTSMTPAGRLAKANMLLKEADCLLNSYHLETSTVNSFIRNYNSICDEGILITFDEFNPNKIYLKNDFTGTLRQIRLNLNSYIKCNCSNIPNTDTQNDPNTTLTKESSSVSNEDKKLKKFHPLVKTIIPAIIAFLSNLGGFLDSSLWIKLLAIWKHLFETDSKR